jgi:hypothetical protein
MALQYGIVTTNKTALTAIMIIQKWEVTDENEFVEANDEAGEVEAVHEVTKPKKCSFEGLLEGSAPASGDELTVDTIVWQIRSVTKSEENEGFTSVSGEGVEKVW